MKEQTDDEFIAALKTYLAQFSEGYEPTVPFFKNDDGSVNREKTLALACYTGFLAVQAAL